jgi:hypothetical protein
MKRLTASGSDVGSETNRLYFEDRAVHDWYRFVLSFPAHLVRDYLSRFCIDSNCRVLDPFCGTGTVLVECKKLGIPSEGIEINPIAHFATQVKTDWSLNPDRLIEHARQVANHAEDLLIADGIEDEALFDSVNVEPSSLWTLSEEEMALLLTNSISPLPLHKTLVLLDCIKQSYQEHYSQHELLALAKSVVYSSSNLRFGPEVGLGTIKHNASIISPWLRGIRAMATDLSLVKKHVSTPANVHLGDSRNSLQVLEPNSIDAVVTSPPYPNEKDYTRTTRLETVLLGFIKNKAELQDLKKALLCSNTRTVYKGDTDDNWIMDYPQIKQLASTIEARRIELGKTSGFEKLYGKVTRLYFGGMARHLAFLRTALRPGASLAYVVGDQASYFRVMIPTGQILAEIAQSLGYELTSIDLFRNRFATATKEQLREEVVLLRWPGKSIHHNIANVSSIKPSPETDNIGGNVMNSLFSDEEYNSSGKTIDSSPKKENENTENDNEDGVVDLTFPSPKKLNRYQRLVEHIFLSKYQENAYEVEFEREDLEKAAEALDIKLPKNLGDIVYSFRYRTMLPESIRKKAPEGKEWTISPSGRSRYAFVAKNALHIKPHQMMITIKIPDSTPGIVAKYALGDEQSLLAKLRYNRLIDIFSRVTCYSLQNHLRTTVDGIGQVETDEIYVGVDRNGVQYIFPVQAKGGNDKIGITQIEQDMALCGAKFPQLVCRSIAAQFMEGDVIALFEFTKNDEGVRLLREAHYRLVPPERMSEEDLISYRNSAGDIDKD